MDWTRGSEGRGKVVPYVFSNSNIFSLSFSNFFLNVRKQISEKIDNFRCEISGIFENLGDVDLLRKFAEIPEKVINTCEFWTTAAKISEILKARLQKCKNG